MFARDSWCAMHWGRVTDLLKPSPYPVCCSSTGHSAETGPAEGVPAREKQGEGEFARPTSVHLRKTFELRRVLLTSRSADSGRCLIFQVWKKQLHLKHPLQHQSIAPAGAAALCLIMNQLSSAPRAKSRRKPPETKQTYGECLVVK